MYTINICSWQGVSNDIFSSLRLNKRNFFFMYVPCILYSLLSRRANALYIYIYIYFLWHCGPTRSMASSFLRFLDHTQRHITVGWTPLDAKSVRRRDLCQTTHNTHNRQTSMPRWDSNPQSQQGAAVYLRLRPRGHWDRRTIYIYICINNILYIVSTAVCFNASLKVQMHWNTSEYLWYIKYC